ncbi:GatB/YqeY domain-containing protein, partial [Desulfobaculum sp.]
MSSLIKRIESDFIAAYKAKDTDRVSVLRMLKTAVKNKQVELQREPEEGEVLDLVTKQVKQRQESVDQFTQAGRTELAEQEAREMAILKDYLPEPLTEEEVAAIVDETIAKTGAAGMQDMGKV